MKIMSLDETIDPQENQSMQACLGKQVELERYSLPESPADLEAIATDPGFAQEFLSNMKYMQKCMNQLLDHQVYEEKKHFYKSLKSAKLTASVISQCCSAAALVDVVAMMQSECKAMMILDTAELKKGMAAADGVSLSDGQYAGVTIGVLLLIAQIFSTILLACSYKNQVRPKNHDSGVVWMRKLKCSICVNDILLELILIVLQIALLGSVGVIVFGTLLLTITSTIYNMAVSVDILRRMSRRSTAYKQSAVAPVR